MNKKLSQSSISKFFVSLITALLLLPLLTWNVNAKLPPLKERSTPAFQFYYPVSSVRFSEDFINHADYKLKLVLKDLPIDKVDKIHVYLLEDLNQYFQEFQPEKIRDLPEGIDYVPPGVIGLAIPSKNVILLRMGVSESDQLIDVNSTFIHELSHICIHWAVKGNKIPRWLDEGFAVYQAQEWSLSRSMTLIFAGLSGELIPLNQLTKNFPYGGNKIDLAYSESFHFIIFLFEEYGRNKFFKLLESIADQQEFEPGFREIYGTPFYVVERDWRRSLEQNYTWIPIVLSGTTVWFLMVFVFIAGYVRKRKQTNRRLNEWEKEEEIIYGEADEQYFKLL